MHVMKRIGQCHGLGRYSPAYNRRYSGLTPGHSVWDLWWTKWQWDRIFSEYFGIPLSVSCHPYQFISDTIWLVTNMSWNNTLEKRKVLTTALWRLALGSCCCFVWGQGFYCRTLLPKFLSASRHNPSQCLSTACIHILPNIVHRHSTSQRYLIYVADVALLNDSVINQSLECSSQVSYHK
jgi:hypothetical protein